MKFGIRAVLCGMLAALSQNICAAAEAKSPKLPLELMTFNLRYPNLEDGANHWTHRKDFVADVIREKSPDIIGVQEAMRSQLDDLEKRLPEYGEIGIGRDDGKQAGEYSAVLYKKAAFEVLESGTFWLSDTPEVAGSKTWKNVCPRICTWGRIRAKAGGRTFYVFNSHWDNASEEARTKGGKLMAERIAARKVAADPVIVTGDFNSGEDSPQITKLKEALKLRDTFRLIHPDEKEAGTVHFWSGSRKRAKIDYILVDAHSTAQEAEILHAVRDGKFPSDHFPVRAKIVLGD